LERVRRGNCWLAIPGNATAARRWSGGSTSTGRVFLLPFPDGALVDRRSFQSDVLWYGRDYWRPELGDPSLLEASLNVTRNSAHG
jgi:hypothetical protein